MGREVWRGDKNHDCGPAAKGVFCSNSVTRGRRRRTWEIVPCSCALGQGAPSFLSFRFAPNRGGRRADKALCPAGDRAMSGSGRTMVHIGAPAPCGAPTRHLGLYAFDGGRTGPTPSGRRGCPSTARGRGCVSPLAGAAPVPRLANASGRRPSNLERDAGIHGLHFTIRQVLFS